MSKIEELAEITSTYEALAPLNANFSRITTALLNTLSRDGSAPNHMLASIDMNGFRVSNLGAPINNSDAVRLSDLADVIAADGSDLAVLATNVGAGLIGTASGSTVQSFISNLDRIIVDDIANVVAIGDAAWTSLEGDNSVYIGDNAGSLVNDPGGGAGGLQNARGIVAIGAQALAEAVYDGWDFSIWIGYNAGRYATGGYCSVSIGERSGLNQNASSEYNTLVGATTGMAITSGKQNTFIGAKSGLVATTASYNVGVGVSSLTGLTTGDDNIAFGLLAGGAITSGGRNIAIGTRALESVTVNSFNVAIGYMSQRFSTGSSNTSLGYQTLNANTTGAGLIAIGADAMAANTTGSNSVAIGAQALYLNQTGDSSVGIGYFALKASTAGNNTAVGYLSGYQITTGTLNALFGRNTGAVMTTATQITAIGDNALSSMQAGDSSTAVGSLALTLAAGSRNTAVGASAGHSGASGAASNTSGTDNTFLGHRASGNSSSATGVLAIGSDAVAEAATGSHGPGIAIGSAGTKVGFDNTGAIYAAAGASVGYWRLKINGTVYKVQLLADA